MWECPKCGAELEGTRTCPICGTAANGADCPVGRQKKACRSKHAVPPRAKAVGVPRRFSVGKLMSMTAFFAVLFGLMKWHDVPPRAFVMVTVFFAGVGIAQALLFGGKEPRMASAVAGAFLYPLIILVADGPGSWLREPFELLVFALILGVAFGALLGLVAGCLVAGLFLSDARRGQKKDQS